MAIRARDGANKTIKRAFSEKFGIKILHNIINNILTLNFLQDTEALFIESCAKMCEENICCSFEWSEENKQCKLYQNCVPIPGERRKGFLTCRKKGENLGTLWPC